MYCKLNEENMFNDSNHEHAFYYTGCLNKMVQAKWSRLGIKWLKRLLFMSYLSTKTVSAIFFCFIAIAFANLEICTTFRKIAKSSLCHFLYTNVGQKVLLPCNFLAENISVFKIGMDVH